METRKWDIENAQGQIEKSKVEMEKDKWEMEARERVIETKEAKPRVLLLGLKFMRIYKRLSKGN